MRCVCLSLLLLLGAIPVGADDKPAPSNPPKLPLGKETTYVTGPLDKEGYIDYQAALNADSATGSPRRRTPTSCCGRRSAPRPKAATMPAEFFKWLGIQNRRRTATTSSA